MDRQVIEAHAKWALTRLYICISHYQAWGKIAAEDVTVLAERLDELNQTIVGQTRNNDSASMFPLEYIRPDGTTGCMRINPDGTGLEWRKLDGRFAPLHEGLLDIPQLHSAANNGHAVNGKNPIALAGPTPEIPISWDYLRELERGLLSITNYPSMVVTS